MANNTDFLQTLEGIIESRLREGSDSSYTARLAAEGNKRIAQKVGEEGVELALAAVSGDRDEQLNEAADLLFHMLVLLRTQDLSLSDVIEVLEQRHRES